MDKLDKRRDKKQRPPEKDYNNVIDSQRPMGNTKTGLNSVLKNLLRKLYRFLDGYMYGYMRYCIIQTGKIPSFRVRNSLYRFVFYMKITKKTVIYSGCEFRSPWNIKADNCVIAGGCIFDGRRGIEIGEHVVFGSGVHIWTEEHSIDDPYFSVLTENAQPVYIETRAWICSDSTILPGVTIGEGAVIASRACVTRTCEPFGVYAGVPAKKIKERNKKILYELPGKAHWHFY